MHRYNCYCFHKKLKQSSNIFFISVSDVAEKNTTHWENYAPFSWQLAFPLGGWQLILPFLWGIEIGETMSNGTPSKLSKNIRGPTNIQNLLFTTANPFKLQPYCLQDHQSKRAPTGPRIQSLKDFYKNWSNPHWRICAGKIYFQKSCLNDEHVKKIDIRI